MASGSVGANDNRDLSGEDPNRGSDYCIVYTRKNRRKPQLNDDCDASATAQPSEPAVSTSPARTRIRIDEHGPRKAGKGVSVGEDGSSTEKPAPEERREGEECSLYGGVDTGPPVGAEYREEQSQTSDVADIRLRLQGNDEPVAVRDQQPQLQLEASGGRVGEERSSGIGETPPEQLPVAGEERVVGGGSELQSNGGRVIRLKSRKKTSGDQERVTSRREELQLSDGETEKLSNGKKLQPSVLHGGQGDDFNGTGDITMFSNGREEPQLGRGQLAVPVGGEGQRTSRHERLTNGVFPVSLSNAHLKPVISRVEDRVRITLTESNSKDEIRGLKRKIESELDEVRNLVKKLEAKVLQVAPFNASNMTNRSSYIGSGTSNFGFYNQPQLTRVNSVVGAVGHPETRPFRHLSVSVMENNHEVGGFAEKEKRTPKANKYYQNSEFILGKDRLPPESNKKVKPNGAGKKYGAGLEHGFGFGFGVDKNRDKVLRSCSNLLQRLMKHKHGWVFNCPVDAKKLGLHDYHDIIKHPMDLGTIKTRLSQNWYKSVKDFAEDVRLVFRNAMTYNPKGQDVHIMAEELSAIFEDRWASIEREFFPYQMYYDAGLPIPTPRKSHPVPASMLNGSTPSQSAPPMRTLDRSESITMPFDARTRPAFTDIAYTGRTPAPKKPKAKDPNKRDMTYEEKQKLSTNLQSLPPEKLDALVQIINKRNSTVSQHNDEIEVDIDNVDAETLWELDRFVTNYKKSLSKNKRKAELAKQAQAAAQGVQVPNPVPASLDSQKENTPGGRINSVPVPDGIRGDNASPSSSSSSSSSDSGSSSSDSDSDSSSADGSDAGHSPGT